jgi:hypothetical protein
MQMQHYQGNTIDQEQGIPSTNQLQQKHLRRPHTTPHEHVADAQIVSKVPIVPDIHEEECCAEQREHYEKYSSSTAIGNRVNPEDEYHHKQHIPNTEECH